jgi:hypothetical protein
MVPSKTPSKCMVISTTIGQESTLMFPVSTTVFMPSKLSDGVTATVLTTGSLKTLGAPHGEKEGSSESRWVKSNSTNPCGLALQTSLPECEFPISYEIN